ncbi:NACHT domain-containing protein [Fusarium keratoplasticum]|nr:NACHT domain-containing protein [Fusarium keratoplasticum]
MARPESLTVAVHKLEAILDPGLRREVSPCTASDIEDTISKMNLADANLPMKQSLAELKALVQKLEKWCHTEEPLLSRDEFSCLIWGPMKFLLEAAQNEEIFDRLLGAYSKIGQEIAESVEFAQFTQLWDESFSKVLDFHCEALELLRNPGLDALFRSEPKESHENLQEVPEDETSDTRDPKRCKITTDSDNKTQKAEENHKLAMSELKIKLQGPDYRRDRERFTRHRIEFNSGTWIFSEEKFQSWYRSTDNTILCISGLLGMGKTVLMSTVANKLLAEKQYLGSETFVGYFYFSHSLQEPHNSLLRALLEQFMDQNAVLLSELLDKHIHAYADGIRETEMLQKLVKRAIETRRTTFLVLDGLDEYTHKELDRTVEWLLSTAKSLPDESILRIIISTRRDSTGLH